MLLTDYACDFPDTVVVVPDRHKFGISDIARLVRMMKSMNSNFDSSVPLQRVDLKCVLDQCSLYLSADVLLDCREEWCFSYR